MHSIRSLFGGYAESMEAIFIILGLMIGGCGAWYFTSSFEENRWALKTRDLEARARFALGESAGLKEKIALLQAETDTLKRTLTDERIDKAKTIYELSASFRKNVMFLGVACLAVGLTLGGGAAGWTVAAHEKAKFREKTVEIEMTARVNELKLELLQKHSVDLETDIKKFQNELMETKVQKTELETKLKILLDSISFSKSHDMLSIDYGRLKNNLAEESSSGTQAPIGQPEETQEEIPFLKSSPFRV